LLERLLNLARKRLPKKNLPAAAALLVYGFHDAGQENKAIGLFEETTRTLRNYRSDLCGDLIQMIAESWHGTASVQVDLVPLFERMIASVPAVRDPLSRSKTVETLAHVLKKLDLFHRFSSHPLFKKRESKRRRNKL
jgi:hypothetical protein